MRCCWILVAGANASDAVSRVRKVASFAVRKKVVMVAKLTERVGCDVQRVIEGHDTT